MWGKLTPTVQCTGKQQIRGPDQGGSWSGSGGTWRVHRWGSGSMLVPQCLPEIPGATLSSLLLLNRWHLPTTLTERDSLLGGSGDSHSSPAICKVLFQRHYSCFSS